MKKLIWGLLFFGMIARIPTLGQSDWQVKAFAGVSDANLVGPSWLGGPGLNVYRFQEYGLRLSWKSNSRWGWESGFSYAKATLQLRTMWIPTGNPPPHPESPFMVSEEPFDYISIPMLATYQLFNFLSLQAGPLVGFQLSDNSSWMEQSGIGYLVGVNLHHYFDRLGVYVQPNFKQHALIGVNQLGQRLTEFGVQVGLAYRLTTPGKK